MEVKKSPKVNLERSIGLSFLMGLVLALSIVFVALEWQGMRKREQLAQTALQHGDIEDAMFVPDNQAEPEPPAQQETPREAVEVAMPEEFTVVDNTKEVTKVTLVSVDDPNKQLPPPRPVTPEPPAKVEEVVDEIFEIVEVQPVPPTGDVQSLLKWISKQLEYPERALDMGIQGKVIVQFVVEKDGSVSNAKVVRPVDPMLDKEALRVVNKMGKWTPGKQQGEAVRSYYTLPIQFKIQ